MQKQIIFLIFIIFFLNILSCNIQPNNALYYFPLKEGNWWLEISSKTGKSVGKLKVMKTEDDFFILKRSLKGLTTTFMYEYKEGKLKIINSIITMGRMKKKKTMDQIILKDPIKVGTTWKDSEGHIYTIVSVNESVEIKIGKFTKCLKIQDVNTQMKNMGAPKNVYISYQYYAPKVGKILTAFKNGKKVFELSEYNVK